MLFGKWRLDIFHCSRGGNHWKPECCCPQTCLSTLGLQSCIMEHSRIHWWEEGKAYMKGRHLFFLLENKAPYSSSKETYLQLGYEASANDPSVKKSSICSFGISPILLISFPWQPERSRLGWFEDLWLNVLCLLIRWEAITADLHHLCSPYARGTPFPPAPSRRAHWVQSAMAAGRGMKRVSAYIHSADSCPTGDFSFCSSRARGVGHNAWCWGCGPPLSTQSLPILCLAASDSLLQMEMNAQRYKGEYCHSPVWDGVLEWVTKGKLRLEQSWRSGTRRSRDQGSVLGISFKAVLTAFDYRWEADKCLWSQFIPSVWIWW